MVWSPLYSWVDKSNVSKVSCSRKQQQCERTTAAYLCTCVENFDNRVLCTQILFLVISIQNIHFSQSKAFSCHHICRHSSSSSAPCRYSESVQSNSTEGTNIPQENCLCPLTLILSTAHTYIYTQQLAKSHSQKCVVNIIIMQMVMP